MTPVSPICVIAHSCTIHCSNTVSESPAQAQSSRFSPQWLGSAQLVQCNASFGCDGEGYCFALLGDVAVNGSSAARLWMECMTERYQPMSRLLLWMASTVFDLETDREDVESILLTRLLARVILLKGLLFYRGEKIGTV